MPRMAIGGMADELRIYPPYTPGRKGATLQPTRHGFVVHAVTGILEEHELLDKVADRVLDKARHNILYTRAE
jgi:hypothetical protein